MSRNKGASLFYRKERNTWIVQYYINDYDDKRTKKSFKEKADAESFLEELMYKKDNKKFVENNGITLKTIIVSNTKKKMESDIISEGQYMRINKTLKQIPEELLNNNIEEITEEDIQKYLNTLKNYSNSSIKKFYELLSQAFRSAYERDYIKLNPMKNVIRPKSNKKDKKVRALTIEEQEKFTDYLINQDIKNTPYKNVFLIQMFTGMRIGEVLALKITDIDLAHNIIKVEHTISIDAEEKTIMKDTPKSFNGMREIPLSRYLKPYVIEQMRIAINNNHKETLLFVNRNGGYVDHRIANKILKKILLNEFDIEDISTHSLRHTFGTRCTESGVKEVALQRIMGHSSVNATLDNYVDISDKLKESELKSVYSYFRDNMNIDFEDFV